MGKITDYLSEKEYNTKVDIYNDGMHPFYHTFGSFDLYKIIDNFHDENWQKIAKDACLLGRSGADCRVMWYSTSIGINYEKWSRDELVCLVQLSDKYKGLRWDKIAKEIGNNRRPIGCLQVWQRSLNPLLLSCKWKFEEDKKTLEFHSKIWN